MGVAAREKSRVARSQAFFLPILLRRSVRIRLTILIPHIPILPLQALTLLLHGLQILVLLRELILQPADLPRIARLVQLVGVFAAALAVALVALDFLFEAQHVEDHDVGAVEDQREEEREAAEVHVALGVEFAGLHFHAFGTEGGASAAWAMVG